MAKLSPEKRIPELDGLRGIAVGLVLLYHFGGNPTSEPAGAVQNVCLFLIQQMWSGVDLFFVLSGFLITGILLRTRENRNYFRSFYARRALRIFPVAFIAIIGWFWVAAPLFRRMHVAASFHGIPTGVDLPSSEQIWFFLFLQNWPWVKAPPALMHLWTLAIEEQFYLVWPFIVLAFYSRLERLCLGIVVGVVLLKLSLFFSGVPSGLLFRTTVCRMDELILGAMLALFRDNNQPARSLRLLSWAASLSLVVLLSLDFNAETKFGPFVMLFSPLLWALSFSGLLLATLGDESWIRATMRFGALRSLGKYSYAIYVFHFPVAQILRQVLRHRFGFWSEGVVMIVAGGAVSWGIAWISWNLVESPILSLKGRFSGIGYSSILPPGEFEKPRIAEAEV